MPPLAQPIAKRILGKFLVDDGCWEWTASKNPAGYGQISTGRGQPPAKAHRVLYELLVGPIPEGLTIDHLCRNRGCVNPSHLEPVTRGENVRRGIGGQMARERKAAQTHCHREHEFTPENTYLQHLSSGSVARKCRACHAMRERDRRRGESNSDR